MSNKRLKSLRIRAFQAQSGCCFYCGLSMWLASPHELGLRPRSARFYQCTAEHLIAQQEGGLDVPENVVAAHTRCNQGRHKRRGPAPSPDVFKQLVRKRLAMGRWWPTPPTGTHIGC
ncbi:HNH endonuclease [Xanthomonas vasicola]|uniref:HNH endonuclease n=2 Tax=Xanthomonas vasicola TaxID=56459 RepID=A0ABD7S474_XANVA|nr:HNH endonuclease [Xanthomonas vasicola]